MKRKTKDYSFIFVLGVLLSSSLALATIGEKYRLSFIDLAKEVAVSYVVGVAVEQTTKKQN